MPVAEICIYLHMEGYVKHTCMMLVTDVCIYVNTKGDVPY